MNGKTIEVVNTDAEGRLVLADALCYAVPLDLSPIVDVATLTGAMLMALGTVAFGVMSEDDQLAARIERAALLSGEKCWRLPMFPEYKEANRSSVADLRNSGGRNAAPITAAWFLREFVDDRPWAHLDIAGVDYSESEKGWHVRGATGAPVPTIIRLVCDMAR
jgi:leucyl aminopeptidase